MLNREIKNKNTRSDLLTAPGKIQLRIFLLAAVAPATGITLRPIASGVNGGANMCHACRWRKRKDTRASPTQMDKFVTKFARVDLDLYRWSQNAYQWSITRTQVRKNSVRK